MRLTAFLLFVSVACRAQTKGPCPENTSFTCNIPSYSSSWHGSVEGKTTVFTLDWQRLLEHLGLFWQDGLVIAPPSESLAIWLAPDGNLMCSDSSGEHECTDAQIVKVLPKPEPMVITGDPYHSSCDMRNSAPEPMDVPAVLVKPKCPGGCVPPPSYYSCADKSRILLTDEQGGKHCIKFPKER